MKKIAMLSLLTALAFPAFAADAPAKGKEASPPQQTSAGQSDAAKEMPAATDAAASQTCWSARKCSGKVLNHKDRHNCKNSGGKSWSDRNGTCYNL
ncbi:MAG: hypothetical protein AB7E15_14460 [Azospira sp.]|jgi:hypothetical protein